MGLTPAERNEIRKRHGDIPQDTLPGMPKADSKPEHRNESARPRWRKLKRDRQGRLPVCSACYAEGDGTVRAIFERTTLDTTTDLLCRDHAEPMRRRDGLYDQKEKRAWRA